MSVQLQVERYLPTNQLGLQVALGTEGPPAGRILLAYGSPHQGKSSLFFQFASDVDRNKGSIDIIETENALDKIYASTFFYHNSDAENQDDLSKKVLKYHKDLLKKDLKTWGKAKDQKKVERLIDDANKRIPALDKLIELIDTGEYPYPKNKIVLSGNGNITEQLAHKLIRDALSEFRLQRVKIIQDVKSLESLETKINEILEKRREQDVTVPHYVIVDSLTGLFPESDLNKEHSSDGNHFGTAKFLAQWIPKISPDLIETNTTIAFVAQQNEKIKMSMWEKSDPILDVVFRGGRQLKFAASLMAGVEKGRKVTRWDGTEVDSGKIKMHKAKQLGGGIATLQAEFYLIRKDGKTIIDFNEPFINTWIKTAKDTDPEARVIGSTRLACPAEFVQSSPDWKEEYEKSIKPLKDILGGKYVTGEPGLEEDDLFFSLKNDIVKQLLASSPYIHQIIKNNRKISALSDLDDMDFI